MKPLKIFTKLTVVAVLVIASFSLCSCNKEKVYSEDVDYAFDDQNFFYTSHEIAKGEAGYYYLDSMNYLIMYFDAKTKKSVPLCTRANCKHDSSSPDCNARVTNHNSSSIFFSDNNIYVLSSEFTGNAYETYFESISPDGSKHEKVCSIGKRDVSEGADNDVYNSNVYLPIVHRGYAYYTSYNDKQRTELYRIRLAKGAEPELIYEMQTSGAPRGYKKHVYFAAVDDSNQNSSSGGVYRFDISSGKLDKISEKLGDICTFIEDTMLYRDSDLNLIKIDLSSLKEEALLKLAERCDAYYDGNHIYTDNWMEIVYLKNIVKTEGNLPERRIGIYDQNFNHVKDIKPPVKNFQYLHNMFGDEHFMFMRGLMDNSDVLEDKIIVYDKSDILTEDGAYEIL